MHPGLLYRSGKIMELDIFIPSLKLAFEYQGQQHYQNMMHSDSKETISRDKEKAEACIENKITLVIGKRLHKFICSCSVPYWWNKTSNSLIATIHKQRPELVK